MRRALTAVLAVLAAGCSSLRVTQTDRSAVEQQLVVRSLDRALAGLDLTRLTGKRVMLDLFALSKDQAFAKEFMAARLQARGVEVVQDSTKADLRLKVFATVMGADHGETLIGVPAFVAPVLAFPIPEIALFKWVRNRGHTEVEIFTYDPHTDRFLDATIPAGVGRSKYDEITILIIFSFSSDDLDERPGPAGR